MQQQQQRKAESLRDIGAPTLAQPGIWSYIPARPDTATLAQERECEEQANRYARYRAQGMTPKQIALLLRPRT